MLDFLSIGPVPCDEDCSQRGTEDFVLNSTRECKAYINQLKRMFPNPEDKNFFKIKWSNHDFGMYPEVVIYYNDDIKISCEYAFNVESKSPAQWDEEAKKELGLL